MRPSPFDDCPEPLLFVRRRRPGPGRLRHPSGARPGRQRLGGPRRLPAFLHPRPRSPARRVVRRVPARQGRSRERAPPGRGGSGQGAQVRRRGLRRKHAAGEGQPGGGDLDPGGDDRADAGGRARHAAPVERRPGAQQGPRDQPGAGLPVRPAPAPGDQRRAGGAGAEHRRCGAAKGLHDRRPGAPAGCRHGQRFSLARA